MGVKAKIKLLEEKPFKVTCMEGDYARSYATKRAAYAAKNRHQKKYPKHKVVVTETVII